MQEYNASQTTPGGAPQEPVPQSQAPTSQLASALGEAPQPPGFNPQPPSDPPDWHERARQCRAEEWTLSNELLALSRRLLIRHIAAAKGNVPLSQVERLLQLSMKLARLSTDLDKNKGGENECRECCRAREEMEAALQRIYGEAAEKRTAAEEAAQASRSPSTLDQSHSTNLP
ncbi:MAG TPA: hypothetical protein VLT36_15095 [Candidatus Dormibacteraeota bacterium]|nr:hypothetical protein [Candidatus Dormibacteraeota bacterium]